MSLLYPYIFNSNKKELTFLGTCIQGEQHDIGADGYAINLKEAVVMANKIIKK